MLFCLPAFRLCAFRWTLCLLALMATGCLLSACQSTLPSKAPALDPMNPVRLKMTRTSLVREIRSDSETSPMAMPGWYARLLPPPREQSAQPRNLVRGYW